MIKVIVDDKVEILMHSDVDGNIPRYHETINILNPRLNNGTPTTVIVRRILWNKSDFTDAVAPTIFTATESYLKTLPCQCGCGR